MKLREAAEAVVRAADTPSHRLMPTIQTLRAALAEPDELAEARGIISALLVRDSLSTDEKRKAGLRALAFLKRQER